MHVKRYFQIIIVIEIVFFWYFSIIIWCLEVTIMFSDLKLAFQSFKKNKGDYLAISFVFGVMLFAGVLLSEFLLGPVFSFIILIIPAIISLKFCAFNSYNKEEVEFKNMKIGFITFFKSVKVYFIVIFKPLLISLIVGILMFSFFYTPAIEIASETMPNLYNDLLNVDTMMYAYEDMFKIEKVRNLLCLGLIVTFIASYVIYFSLKLKRDFIPFVAFEMPINSKRAIDMNKKMVKGNYMKLFISNIIVELAYLIPLGVAVLLGVALNSNEIYSNATIILVSSMAFCVISGPISLYKQLHYVYNYKTYSKPMKEDFDNELKNILKEIEELQKKINNKN